MIPAEKPTKAEIVGGRVPAYTIGEKERAWIAEQLQKNGGAFSLSEKSFKELLCYHGNAKPHIVVQSANKISRTGELPYRFKYLKKDNKVAVVKHAAPAAPHKAEPAKPGKR